MFVCVCVIVCLSGQRRSNQIDAAAQSGIDFGRNSAARTSAGQRGQGSVVVKDDVAAGPTLILYCAAAARAAAARQQLSPRRTPAPQQPLAAAGCQPSRPPLGPQFQRRR